jgi:hypothetical protein
MGAGLYALVFALMRAFGVFMKFVRKVLFSKVFQAVHHFCRATALLIIMAHLSMGCGAMLNDRKVKIPVETTPPGARVYLDGIHIGVSPISVEVEQRKSHVVEVDADGYTKQTAQLEPSVDSTFIVLDCLLLILVIVPGVVALAVDGGTGDWKVIDNSPLSIVLTPAGTSQTPSATAPQTKPQTPPAITPTTPENLNPIATGCQYDAQCKGDRVCNQGQCVDVPKP